jgi:hypothetical protein
MDLTPYDTGKRAEPKVWEARHRESDEDYGKVDFNAEDDYTIATLHIRKDGDDGYILGGYTNEPLRIDIDYQGMPEDEPLFICPSAALQAKVQETIDNLSTETERIESEVYWQQGQALILVGGETGYRKQQAIMVYEPGYAYGDVSSAIVKSWATGVRDTREG